MKLYKNKKLEEEQEETSFEDELIASKNVPLIVTYYRLKLHYSSLETKVVKAVGKICF